MKINKKYREVFKREVDENKADRKTLELFISKKLKNYKFEDFSFDPLHERFIIKLDSFNIYVPNNYLYRNRRKKRFQEFKNLLSSGRIDLNCTIRVDSDKYALWSQLFSFKLRKLLRDLILVKRHELYWKDLEK